MTNLETYFLGTPWRARQGREGLRKTLSKKNDNIIFVCIFFLFQNLTVER